MSQVHPRDNLHQLSMLREYYEMKPYVGVGGQLNVPHLLFVLLLFLTLSI